MIGVHWFRRDLRVRGNPAFERLHNVCDGRVLGVFCVDPAILSRPDLAHARFALLLKALHALREELKARGGELLILEGPPEQALPCALNELKSFGQPVSTLSFNRDYEPYARTRDSRVQEAIEELRIQVLTERDHLLIEPSDLHKPDQPGSYYQVFGAFQKRWNALLETDEILERLEFQRKALIRRNPLAIPLPRALLPRIRQSWQEFERIEKAALKQVKMELPEAGEKAALSRLREFGKKGLKSYPTERDRPDHAGTSQISIHLKFGTLTVAEAIAELNLKPGSKFLSELVWREFYYHILWHRPDVEHHAFQRRYEKLKFENRSDLFEAWKAGRTGFPLVDAGMRQLAATGWMHNRLRMIVASFLTKDLLIDWRWGERYFMNQLLDGDLAPNNGGWQWAASTGCDPQPYFRIFNPILQSKRYDPQGDYIRRWVPELSALSRREIHEPWKSGLPEDYPERVVDHSERAKRAIALYRGT